MELVEIARVLDPIFMRNVSNVILDYIRPKDPIITHPNLHKFFVENGLRTSEVNNSFDELEELYVADEKFQSFIDDKKYEDCLKTYFRPNSKIIQLLAASVPWWLHSELEIISSDDIILCILESGMSKDVLRAFIADLE